MKHLTERMLAGLLVAIVASGCGTTKWSDSSRTATEQLLISTAVDKAINEINLEPLAGKSVFFDTQHLQGTIDEHYVVGSLMQTLLSHGCALKETRDQADYVVVARAGAVGTNRHDVMVGVPSVNLPVVSALAGVPSSIPEIPFAKTTEQQGVAKIALFAYNRKTGRAVWQSGAFPTASYAKDSWILGAGPFQRGSIYDGTRFAGSRLIKPFRSREEGDVAKPRIPVTAEVVFEEPPDSTELQAVDGAPEGESAAPAKEVAERASEGEPTDAVAPVAHVLRLPPTDLAERPDLAAPASSSDEPRLLEGEREWAESLNDIDEFEEPNDEPVDVEEEASHGAPSHSTDDQRFDLFDPGTWF